MMTGDTNCRYIRIAILLAMIKVLLKTVEEGALNTLDDFHLVCDKISASS